MNQLHFGTDGIRGNASQFPFTTEALYALGSAIGAWGRSKYPSLPSILIAHDTRESCQRIKQVLMAGLHGQQVHCIDGGTLPTPAVLQIIRKESSCPLGIMISASHNPFYDNGIKIFDVHTGKLSRADENAIEENFSLFSGKPASMTPGPSESTGALHSVYVKSVLDQFPHHFLAGQRVVLDCANGATHAIAPEIFRKLGASVVVIGNRPNGININEDCGALHPQTLIDAVQVNGALIGFAFDGDGDRVIAVTRHGVVKDGDDLLAILLDHPMCKQSTQVVGTIMTNHGFAAHVEKKGKSLVRTKVGDKYIAAALAAQVQPLGGETSGHIIMTDYLPTGDGIFVALRVLQTMLATRNYDLVTFDKYPQSLINVPVQKKDDLSEAPYRDIITRHELQVPKGRVVVRYSGTENVLRVMVEDPHKASAEATAHSLAHELQSRLETAKEVQ